MTSLYPVECEFGYQGILCNDCVKNNSMVFQRVGKNKCDLCPRSVSNGLKIMGFFLIMLSLIFLVVISNIRK